MQLISLYQELTSGPQLIRQLVSDISPDAARYKPDAHSWSLLEVICHLYDEEREDFRPRLDIILNHPDNPWPPIDPQGWVTARRYNEQDPGEMLESFMNERKRSLDWLRGLSPDWDTVYRSPFGEMRAGDMLCSWVAHDGLHIRQLGELRRIRLEALAEPYDLSYAGEW